MYISKLTVKYQIDCSMSYFILIWQHILFSRSHLSLPEWFTWWPLCLCLTLSLTKHQQETSPSHPNLESIYWPANFDHKQTESRAIHNNNCLNVSYMSWELLCKRGCAFVVEEMKTRFFMIFLFPLFLLAIQRPWVIELPLSLLTFGRASLTEAGQSIKNKWIAKNTLTKKV